MHIASNPAHKQLKTRRQAAEYLGISPHTLAVWASTKRHALPMVRIGRFAKYLQSDLDSFIERNTIGREALQ